MDTRWTCNRVPPGEDVPENESTTELRSGKHTLLSEYCACRPECTQFYNGQRLAKGASAQGRQTGRRGDHGSGARQHSGVTEP